MANQFSEGQKKQLLQAFKLFDKDSDGEISEKEMSNLLHDLDPTQTEEQIAQLLENVDADSSGTIQFTEFLQLMGKKMACVNNPSDIREAFHCIDTNNDGFIQFQELKTALKLIGDTSNDTEINNMIKEADQEGKGKVSFEEFKKLMLR